MEQPLTANAQMIKGQIESLIKLQELDDEIGQRRQKVREREGEIDRSERVLQAARRSLDERKQELERLTKERRDAERLVKERQEQISKLGGQLFDVKTNEAYNALQNEIKQKKQETTVQEERILEMMLSEDEVRAAQDRLTAEIKQQEAQAASVQRQHRGEIACLEGEAAGVRARWDELAKDVPADLLSRYQRLRDAKGGRALGKIENGMCSGCHLAVRPQAVIELKKYRSLLTCDNCARILYTD